MLGLGSLHLCCKSVVFRALRTFDTRFKFHFKTILTHLRKPEISEISNILSNMSNLHHWTQFLFHWKLYFRIFYRLFGFLMYIIPFCSMQRGHLTVYKTWLFHFFKSYVLCFTFQHRKKTTCIVTIIYI